MTAYRLFGIEIRTALELPGAWAAPGGPAVASVELVRRHSDSPEAGDVVWETVIDGRPLSVRSRDAEWGKDCRFVFRQEADVIEWTSGPIDHASYRFLLDTVAFLAALCLGREALHAATVVVGEGAVALAGASGMGKSTLAAALLERGARLLSDDVTVVEAAGDRVLAYPGAPSCRRGSS
jgi:hypothetical protein